MTGIRAPAHAGRTGSLTVESRGHDDRSWKSRSGEHAGSNKSGRRRFPLRPREHDRRRPTLARQATRRPTGRPSVFGPVFERDSETDAEVHDAAISDGEVLA